MTERLFGYVVQPFSPLSSQLPNTVYEEVEVTSDSPYSKEWIVSVMKKQSFYDPRFTGCVRTPKWVIEFDGVCAVQVTNMESYKPRVKNKRQIYRTYADYEQRFPLRPENDMERLLLLDVRHTGVYDGEDGRFKTEMLRYQFEEGTLRKVYFEDMEVGEVDADNEGVTILLKDGQRKDIRTPYSLWWAMEWRKQNESCFQPEFFIHANVLRAFGIKTKACYDFWMTIWYPDYTENGVVTEEGDVKRCEAWRFQYTLEGNCLMDVKMPNGDEIRCFEILDDHLRMNGSYETKISKVRPERIPDLIEGNRVSLLSWDSFSDMEMHAHSIYRYERRVADRKVSESDIPTISKEMIETLYHQGVVVEGAHSKKRRKIETDTLGFVITDGLIISLWTK